MISSITATQKFNAIHPSSSPWSSTDVADFSVVFPLNIDFRGSWANEVTQTSPPNSLRNQCAPLILNGQRKVHGTVQLRTVLGYDVSCCTALCCTILYNTVLCCTAHQRDAPQYKRCTVLFQYILNNTSRIISGPRRWISCPANFDNQVLARIRVWTRRWGSNRAQWPRRGSRYTFLPDILGARVKCRPNPFPWGGGRLV